ncbi:MULTISPECIES: bifunctional ADP-dependent NAD(P)H-hydrate dehydratase/NAD(P)H-hydrate epimerase [unclassified Aureispira]|uniref:bifunctional ADP-dependent NAD(P)H-hydrate dehydratase/NAD(P)H-hydrate epimerase n=1 Tax=unclassified Aureispira TaxID=2649989 RepID=UPI0006972766|nr:MULTISPECIES: bifunctional ADP-dependent NAD(P)H-hydrate dehydratase/NAD(P)H-hydrate epimerase [unclassified Aureispira]WMX16804.1 bifunctional ADP-dependent NAD(P)H-hydrate dehydratase/NAD(P)H-hydrate epimerase [Aureispira sp. CCB-E]
MKILSTTQTREADAYTIEHEPILSIDLMERASRTFVEWFEEQFPKEKFEMVSVICGKGNNGGDGLAIARLLEERGYDIAIFILNLTDKVTEDFKTNLERVQQLQGLNKLIIKEITSVEDMPVFGEEEILIDAILGSGLSRPIEGELAEILHFLNECKNTVVAVDIPTGVFTDAPTTGACIEADYTFAFEFPKLAFLFPENFHCVGDFVCKPIGLDQRYIDAADSPFYYITSDIVKKIYKKRDKFAHKGVFGHALLIMGSYGKMGAAILATRACLRAGVGLVTVHVPICGYEVMQTAVPEAMVSLDEDRFIFTKVYDLPKYSTIAIGCGLSTKNRTRNALCYMLKHMNSPTVLDADALNILGQSPDWFEYIPKNSILTPHPKEFERMFGKAYDNFERNELQRQKAQEFGVYIILKGANTCIATPEGDCYFNSTGNPGMGTAGSGDVLTGILAGLLAQEYNPLEACILGVYIHGLAGDIAAEIESEESLTAGDLVNYLGKAFLNLRAL